VTNSARTPARAGHNRSFRLLLVALLACGAAFLALVGTAGAVVTEVEGTKFGFQPRTEILYQGNDEVTPAGELTKRATIKSFDNPGGNVVLHGTNVYGIYWDPNAVMHREWMIKTDTFLQRLGRGSGELGTILSALGQYRDRTNTGARYSTVFAGTYTDTVKYPTTENCTDPNPLAEGAEACLTDAQLREQLEAFIAARGLPKGMNTVYYVMTPPGVTVCLDKTSQWCSDFKLSKAELEEGVRSSTSYRQSFCSYHGAVNPDNATSGDANTLLYAAIPWTAGYSGHLSGFVPPTPGAEPYAYRTAYDCQAGGWHPESVTRLTVRDEPRPLTELEVEVLKGEKGTPKERREIEERIRLEGPHVQEPNQEGAGESGQYNAGLSDLIDNQIMVEQANMVTDPLLGSWRDSEGFEVTDECRDEFGNTVGEEVTGVAPVDPSGTEAGTLANETIGSEPPPNWADGDPSEGEEPGRYYINNVWSASTNHCVGGVGLDPRFTPPSPVKSNEVVSFNGMESTVGLIKGTSFSEAGVESATYSTFAWNFGDGSAVVTGFAPGAPTCEAPWLSPCAASVLHAYTYGGEYDVTLTVTDVAGNVSSVTHDVTVSGPPAPTPSTAPGGGAPGGSPAGGPSATAAPATPLASASILSRSLRTVARKGLLVTYSVNEQVAGQFDVLIASSTAKRLKISGTPATGLPAGSAPELVIAKAVLVTTKAGKAKMTIRVPKRVAAAFKHARRAGLMLRLSVHNTAAVGVTAISSATLSR